MTVSNEFLKEVSEQIEAQNRQRLIDGDPLPLWDIPASFNDLHYWRTICVSAATKTEAGKKAQIYLDANGGGQLLSENTWRLSQKQP